MMDLIIGLKVDSYKSLAACAKIIRQFENYSLSELKTRIENHNYVLCYDSADDIGVKKVIRCYDQLIDAGAKVSLYELDHRPTTIELVRNLDQMYDEIGAEIEAEEED